MKIPIVYLLGAGRSGTTLMATVLNSHEQIETVGEMHQFFEHLQEDKKCSCGSELNRCVFWSPILSELNYKNHQIVSHVQITSEKERHSNIGKYLFKKKTNKRYLEIQEKYFTAISKNTNATWLLDSSKYIARFLLLKRSGALNVKGIYVVRDIRGVINSFNKQVQTPKSPMSTIFYYWLINFFGQVVCALNKDVIKIKYEDFVSNPEIATNLIYNHVFVRKSRVTLPNEFEIPHIIGGNRMKKDKSIVIRKDEQWKNSLSRTEQIKYYMLTFPIMILNKYKI